MEGQKHWNRLAWQFTRDMTLASNQQEVEKMLDNWEKYVEKFNRNDEEIFTQMIPDDQAAEWIRREAPYFECPDQTMEEAYYFRWWVFRKHIKQTEEGRIITEFLPKVPWAGAYNSINCANGHHLAEARWLKNDRGLALEYVDFWLRGSGNEYSYSSWIAAAVYELALVRGDKNPAVGYLDDLVRFYETVEDRQLTEYGLFWSDDDRDAMERSISGKGLRPTLNSYMYANALAIARISGWAGRTELQRQYQAKADRLKEKILSLLWDRKDQFFKVIPMEEKHTRPVSLDFSEIPKEHNVREEIGYIPWGMGILENDCGGAWKYLMDSHYFKTPYGPATAERNHPYFMKPASDHECLWNGPVWPFATTQTLNSMIRLLQNGSSKYVNQADFVELLKAYAQSHRRIREDGETVSWLDENIDPDTGEWLSRKILKGWNWREDKGGYERGKDYNHSAFCDLVIRGICGIWMTEGDELIIEPLLLDGVWDYFMLDELPYHGHSLTIAYDKDGSRYGKGAGLWIASDGKMKASADRIKRLAVKLDEIENIMK